MLTKADNIIVRRLLKNQSPYVPSFTKVKQSLTFVIAKNCSCVFDGLTVLVSSYISTLCSDKTLTHVSFYISVENVQIPTKFADNV